MLKLIVGALSALAVTATAASATVLLPAPPRGETWTYEIITTDPAGYLDLVAISDYSRGWDFQYPDFPGEWMTSWGDGFVSAGGGLNQGSTGWIESGSLSAALGINPTTGALVARVSNRLPESYNFCGAGTHDPCGLVFTPLQVVLWSDSEGSVTVTSKTAVPEPATWAMMIIGLGAVGSMVRASRRRNSAVAG